MATTLAAPSRAAAVSAANTLPFRGHSNTGWSRFRRDRVATAALVVLVLLALLALAAPLIALNPSTVDLDSIKTAPTLQHPLGTDSAGRDVWARLVHGARVSMSVGVVAVGIAMFVGSVVGLLSGY